ncbi:hypothetical protein BV22DRAFT_642650 [Leucogyrophana mollusca]|uniref:Uncharacterized protein n=1 Tax=Leucogyrophana mollusca TaxID=85980 RepID=A0ACB8BB22_9AGAM|nr:hypothetical protein BV22DRAFT_642650 [Leucogyrophana mollusca]
MCIKLVSLSYWGDGRRCNYQQANVALTSPHHPRSSAPSVCIPHPQASSSSHYEQSPSLPSASSQMVSRSMSFSVDYKPRSSASGLTTIPFAIICIFVFRVYGTSPEIGSVSRIYDLLTQADVGSPFQGYMDGSYMTMKPNQGAFETAALLSGFAGVFCDQGNVARLQTYTY